MNSAGTVSQRCAPPLTELVALLPELYQPIYGHPELSAHPSRACDDRLTAISAVCRALSQTLQRPLRILDLGCAQGYISLRLAELGAAVVGVDIVPANLAVCQALAAEYPHLEVEFISGAIEVILRTVDLSAFDLTLGLSVFHHLIHSYGIDSISQLVTQASTTAHTWLLEVALAQEPAKWAASQPGNPTELAASFAFIHEIARFPNHLSDIQRPMIFASNTVWYLNETIGTFDRWSNESHQNVNTSFLDSRKYYYGAEHIVKYFSLAGPYTEINIKELTNEATFLIEHPTLLPKNPQLTFFGQSDQAAWLVREKIPGDTLADCISLQVSFDQDRIILDILSQLVVLEEAGLYHNDLRLWNVLLLPSGGATLIDFGAITPIAKDGVWPQNLVMGFWNFICSVCSENHITWSPNPSPFISPFNLPERYITWAKAIWKESPQRWSFAFLLQQLRTIGLPPTVVEPLTAVELWMREIEEYLNKLNSQHLLTTDQVTKAARLQLQQTSVFQSIIDNLIYKNSNS